MADIKWIKLYVDMFDNRKIKFIRKLPDGNDILLCWIMIMASAGKCNTGGYIFLTENIPYTPEILANEYEMPLSTIKLAIETFKRLNMVNTDQDGSIYLPNWEEYQSADRMAELREYNRLAKRKEREKQKQLRDVNDMSMTSQRQSSQCQGTDIDLDLDKDKRKKDIRVIFDFWNSKKIVTHRAMTDKLNGHINSKLEIYTTEEINGAITNYATVLHSDEYQWTYKWSLGEFLTRENGMVKFLDENSPLDSLPKTPPPKGGQPYAVKQNPAVPKPPTDFFGRPVRAPSPDV
jgi:predicted phage replisome organizer